MHVDACTSYNGPKCTVHMSREINTDLFLDSGASAMVDVSIYKGVLIALEET